MGEFVQNQAALDARRAVTLARYVPRTEREAKERATNLEKRSDRAASELAARASGRNAVAAKQASDHAPGSAAVDYGPDHLPLFQRTANP